MSEIEANGVRLHHEVTGNGPPLVFVHGMCRLGPGRWSASPMMFERPRYGAASLALAPPAAAV